MYSQHYCFDIGHYTLLRNRQNWWEPLPTTVRSIRSNDTVSKTVITVTSETVDLHEGRWLFCGCAIKGLIYEKVDIQTLPLHSNHKNTNFAIGGFLAGLHRSPLTLLFIFQDSLATFWLITSKTVQPTNKWSIINTYVIFLSYKTWAI